MTIYTEHYEHSEAADNAYSDGYRAYQNLLKPTDNPFNTSDEFDLHLAWRGGYDAAAWDD